MGLGLRLVGSSSVCLPDMPTPVGAARAAVMAGCMCLPEGGSTQLAHGWSSTRLARAPPPPMC